VLSAAHRLKLGPLLIVDDDEGLRESLREILEDCGYRVHTASNGIEALEAARQQKPAVILLDLHMPVMNGWEFRKQQLGDAALSRVPTIVITAGGSNLHRLHVNTVLIKPLDLPRLIRAIERIAISSAVS
jgi:CheY-like chemotaxis protein